MPGKYKYLWFDIGYTLLFTEREQSLADALKLFGVERSLDDIEVAFHLTDKLFMREYPGMLGTPPRQFMPCYLGLLFYRLGIRLDLMEFSERWLSSWNAQETLWKPFPFVETTLASLVKEGFTLGVISNWDHSAHSLLEKWNLRRFFDQVVISCDVACQKPSKEIFRIAVERSGVEPARSLYIGDNYYDDKRGASTVGMDAVIINRFGSMGVEELSDVRIIPDIRHILSVAGEPL